MPLTINELKELVGDLVISVKELQKELVNEKLKTTELSAKIAEILEQKEKES